ncbi:MAG: CAF17-like 4Fe-4S cluster assembly/insertion protein YgfZ [Alphaproteobacteria bacterium]
MNRPNFANLDQRGVIAISGDDARPFLQGLISQDVEKVDSATAVYGAFLTPQGKFLHDFCIAQDTDGTLLLDCEASGVEDLRSRLSRYKLRAKVTLQDVSNDYETTVAFGPEAAKLCGLEDRVGAARTIDGGVIFVDPRLADLGCRAIAPRDTLSAFFTEAGFAPATPDDYDSHRLALGIPDGSRDLEREKATLLESNFDELNGIDWDKGCYMGQELTARTKYRALLKRRIIPVRIEGPLPPHGTPILADGKPVGTIRSGRGDRAMALLRLEALENKDVLRADESVILPDPVD